ncbi:WD40 repeat domain-containing protein, partial [Aggregatibacter actinomycetemcomitans]
RISPGGKWVVTGSDNRRNLIWSLQDVNKRSTLARVNDGIYDKDKNEYDKSKLLPVPEKFNGMQKAGLFNVLAIAFLTDKDFILFDRNVKDRIHPIYTTGDVWIQGYVDLGKRKSISQSNLSIGSSPETHILVISQGSGIAVYRYHPETKELDNIWVAD